MFKKHLIAMGVAAALAYPALAAGVSGTVSTENMGWVGTETLAHRMVQATPGVEVAQSLPLRLFYRGPMFRHERPQKGRLRQFHQVGVELLGVEGDKTWRMFEEEQVSHDKDLLLGDEPLQGAEDLN